jgi:sporulation protein YlmC with PRC-barrel domain
MRGVELLNKRVVTGGIELGRVVDVILDENTDREIGLDVRCKDGVNRFLPIATADVGEEDVVVETPLVLLEADQLAFYRTRGRALRSSR